MPPKLGDPFHGELPSRRLKRRLSGQMKGVRPSGTGLWPQEADERWG